MNEADLTKKIMRKLKGRGGFWVKVHGGPFQVTGLPDIIGCYKGRFVGLEVKVPGRESTLTPRQSLILSQILAAGGIAQMITSVEEAETALGE